MINMMLLVKDQYQVSGSAYHEFAKICQEMPRHQKLKKTNIRTEQFVEHSTYP